MENNIEIQTERYLAGEMSFDEKLAFEKIIAVNDDLKEHILLSKKLVEKHEYVAFKKNLLSAEKKYLQNNKKRFNPFYWSVAAAAILLISIFSYYQSIPVNLEKLYAIHSNKIEMPSFIVQGNNQQKTLEEIEIAFKNKNYNKSIRFCDIQLKTSSKSNPNILIYKGISLLNLNNEKDALIVFNKLKQSDAIDASKGNWYEAITYMKLNNKIALKNSLEIIIKNPTNYNYNKAKSILKSLE
ncbi:hypothetical protein [uncultured Tenacibaculum sp.]|uniref:hypothetical protein n=1 Tax=uncultured Tenacibaculum sp. TaxID=174713 RepID=UPI00262B55E5|nr:hypothetical protein [uncultured Tenacibaculum sp.]